LTAAKQSAGRGYLMYNCTVTSAQPGTETASQYLSKPGYFGRPWQANTSEVVFFETKIDSTNFPGAVGRSLINPLGWLSTLGGESPLMYEYGTIEASNEDNSSSRASWATLLSSAVLSDGTEITPLNFTKGLDGWDPLPELRLSDNDIVLAVNEQGVDKVKVYASNENIYVVNVTEPTMISLFNTNGVLVQKNKIKDDEVLTPGKGLWIVKVQTQKYTDSLKVIIP